jgi:hypothetical protein
VRSSVYRGAGLGYPVKLNGKNFLVLVTIGVSINATRISYRKLSDGFRGMGFRGCSLGNKVTRNSIGQRRCTCLFP